jgi:hypothetical protein
MLQATAALTPSLLPAAAALLPVPGPAAPDVVLSGSAAAGAPSAGAGSAATAAPSTSSAPSSPNAQQLSDDQHLAIAWLASRDREVRAHEAAHQAAGGTLVAGVSFQFETGPDGRSYAVGGDVTIDSSTVPGNPQATVAKMRQVRDAALAPAQPSAQDEMVAAQAEEQALEAEMEVQAAASTALASSHAPAADGADRPATSPASAPATTSAAGVEAGGSVRQGHMIAAYAAAQATAVPDGMPTPLFA